MSSPAEPFPIHRGAQGLEGAPVGKHCQMDEINIQILNCVWDSMKGATWLSENSEFTLGYVCVNDYALMCVESAYYYIISYPGKSLDLCEIQIKQKYIITIYIIV